MAASTESQGARCVCTQALDADLIQHWEEYPCLYDVSSPSLVTSQRYLGLCRRGLSGEILWCAHTGCNAVGETPADRNTRCQDPSGLSCEVLESTGGAGTQMSTPEGTLVQLTDTNTRDLQAPKMFDR